MAIRHMITHYSLFMTEYTDGELHYSLGPFGTYPFAAYPFPRYMPEIQKQVLRSLRRFELLSFLFDPIFKMVRFQLAFFYHFHEFFIIASNRVWLAA